MFRGNILSSCSFEVYSISFKLGRSSNSRFVAAHREAWRSYCQVASDEDCPGLKRIIVYEIKLGVNCCYLHINIHSRSSKNLLSIACIHTDRTSWNLNCISHLSLFMISYLHLYDSFCCFGALDVMLQATQLTEESLQRPSLLSHKQNI